jgi:signal transduction histidine kinase
MDRRMLTLGFTGGAATLLLAALTFLTWRNVRRQMERAQLQEELAATVSHELRTPVTSMRVLIESLLEEENLGDSKTREYLELVARENARLSRLIENFLTLAKLERSKAAPAQPVTVEEIIERIEPRARLKIAPNLPDASVRVDLAAIEVALHNLIDNACKYSPADSLVELSVAVEGANVRFAIRDEGPGLSREESARVWLPFERLAGTRAPGCGLGLAIVQRIAAQAGGSVDLQSAVGEGSTFGIILPSA